MVIELPILNVNPKTSTNRCKDFDEDCFELPDKKRCFDKGEYVGECPFLNGSNLITKK